MTAAAPALRREVEAVGLISAAHFLSHFYQLALPPLFILIHEDIGIGYLALGSAVAAYNIATAVLQTPIGLLVDRIGARGVLIAGLAVNAGAIAAVGFAETYWEIMAAMIVAGAGNAVFHPADFALLSSSVDDRRMGRAFSVHSLAGSLGFAAAPVSLLFLAAVWDWRAALIATGVAGVALACLLPAFSSSIRDDRPRGKKGGGADWTVLFDRTILSFFGFYALSAAAGAGISGFSVVAFIAIYGASPELAGGVLTAFYLLTGLGVALGGYIADRWNRPDAVLGICYAAAACALAAVATGAMAFWLVAAAFGLAGVFRGLVNPSRDVLLKRLTPAGAIGTVFGFVTAGFNVGLGTAPVLYGWMMDLGRPEAVFWIAAGFTVLTIGMVFAARRPLPGAAD
ncbi:MAG: MFS transporter [Defluviicoccus sp.]|nr:MFS transporter [Defluviicoccus sp.]MDE0278966.1 MFS transporter [Defluviicoccus sp.]